MKAEDILHAHELDILFDGRHTSYGAYRLRRDYPKRIKIALALVFMLVALVSVIALFYKPAKKPMITLFEHKSVHIAREIEPAKKPEVKKPEQPRPLVKAKPVSTQAFVNRVEVVNNQAVVPKIRALHDSIVIDNFTSSIPGSGQPVVQVAAVLSECVSGIPGPPKPPVVSGPLASAEIMPEFPGGLKALRAFLERNLQTPADMEPGSQISVKMKFVVGYDGKLRGFETIQDGGTAYNDEVLRVLRKMPDWNPGRSNGEKVSVYYVLPVTFAMAE